MWHFKTLSEHFPTRKSVSVIQKGNSGHSPGVVSKNIIILYFLIQSMTTVVLTVIFFRNSKLFRKYFEVLKFLNFQKPLNLLIKISKGHIFFEKNYIFEVSISKNKNCCHPLVSNKLTFSDRRHFLMASIISSLKVFPI